MAIVDGSLQLGYKNTAWFTANASLVLLVGQIVYLEQTGTYKIGDGTTQLSALSFLGGSQGVQSVTGSNVDNTDPTNPVVNTPNLDQVLAADTNANNLLEIAALNRVATTSSYVSTFFINFFHGSTGTLLKMSINSFIAGIRTNLDLVYTTTSAVATQITTALSGYLTAATAASTYVAKTTWIDISSTVTITGFSGTPTVSVWYKINDGIVTVIFKVTGTSNATNFIIDSLPFTIHASQPLNYTACRVTNNGVNSTTPGRARLDSTFNNLVIQRDFAGALFTASGTKASEGQIIGML